jgi:hypothetical protein
MTEFNTGISPALLLAVYTCKQEKCQTFAHNISCANPPDLSNTGFIDTEASKLLVMPTTKSSAATSNNKIIVIQPSGNHM